MTMDQYRSLSRSKALATAAAQLRPPYQFALHDITVSFWGRSAIRIPLDGC